MQRLVMSIQNKEPRHDQMPRVSTLLGGMFYWEEKPMREELDRVMHMLHVTDPELYNDYRFARVIKDIGVKHLKTRETAGAAETAGSLNQARAPFSSGRGVQSRLSGRSIERLDSGYRQVQIQFSRVETVGF